MKEGTPPIDTSCSPTSPDTPLAQAVVLGRATDGLSAEIAILLFAPATWASDL
jgi:hypothetical protein